MPKKEILTVRQILNESENDRVKERQEKLKVVRQMIELTKQKTSILEELEYFKENNYHENFEYSRLYEKYEQALEKIKALHKNCAIENERVQKEYINELQNIKLNYEKGIIGYENESRQLETSLEELKLKCNEHKISSDKDLKEEFPNIVIALCEDGIVDDTTSGKEIMLNLFTEYKRLFNEMKMKTDQTFHDDQLKMFEKENEKLKNLLKEKEDEMITQLKESETSEKILKNQIDELLSQKTKAIVEKENVKVENEMMKEENETTMARWENTKEILSKKNGRLTVTQENLANVTDEMKMLEVKFESAQRQISVKDAEILRLQQDLEDEKLRRSGEEERSKKFEIYLSETRKELYQCQMMKSDLQKQIKQLEEELHEKSNQRSSEQGDIQMKPNQNLIEEIEQQKLTIQKLNNDLKVKENEILEGNNTTRREIREYKEQLERVKVITERQDKQIEKQQKEIEKHQKETERYGVDLSKRCENMEMIRNMEIIPVEIAPTEAFEDFIIPTNEVRQHCQPPDIMEDLIVPVQHEVQESVPSDELEWIIKNTPIKEDYVVPFIDASNYSQPDSKRNEEKNKSQNKGGLCLEKITTSMNGEDGIAKFRDENCEEETMRTEETETVACLKVLVADNEAYVKCITEQQNFISSLKDENIELRKRLNETIYSCEAEFENSMRMKAKLKDMMHRTSYSEVNLMSEKQKQEIASLKIEIKEERTERKNLKLELEEKSNELDKMQNDLNTMKNAIELNLESERRSKEFVEEQLKLVVQDRGHTLVKLKSSELANKILQNKLLDLQKWHNEMEFQLLNVKDNDRIERHHVFS